MAIQLRTTENTQLNTNETALLDENDIHRDSQSTKENSAGLALHQLFDEDILHSSTPQTIESNMMSPTLWGKFLSWLKGETENNIQIPSVENIEETVVSKAETINQIPELEPPASIPDDLKNIKFPSIPKKVNNHVKLSSSDVEEAIALMSERSIESIMFLIFKMQIELEKENANVAEGTYSKYVDFQKMQQKVLLEIKDVLVNDEKMAQRFGIAQNITLAAQFLAGIVAVAVSYSVLAPLVGFLSSSAAAGLTVTTMGGKAYFQRQMNEHKAGHETYTHYNQYYIQRADDSRERLMTTAEADSVFKERWIQLLRRSDKMRKLVLKK